MESKLADAMTWIASAVLAFIVIFGLIHYFDDGEEIDDEWK